MFVDLSSPYCPYYAISRVYTLTLVCTGILPLSEIFIRALWAYSWFGPSCCPSAEIELGQQEISQDEDEKSRSCRYRVLRSSYHLLSDRADRQRDRVSLRAK